jgi:hypothetical protein
MVSVLFKDLSDDVAYRIESSLIQLLGMTLLLHYTNSYFHISGVANLQNSYNGRCRQSAFNKWSPEQQQTYGLFALFKLLEHIKRSAPVGLTPDNFRKEISDILL